MTTTQIEAQAEKIVADYWARANVQSVQICDRIPVFLKGCLYVIEIVDAVNGVHENYVYVTNDNFYRYDNVRDLSTIVGKKATLMELVQEAFFFSGVSGAIAILITLTICYTYIAHPEAKIPELFSNALTTILGFYFGSAVQKLANR